MSGASLLDSKAAFKNKVLEYGLTNTVFEAIVRRGVDTLSKAAYAVGAPGVVPAEDALRAFLNPESPATVEQGQVAIARRLIFEAQTLAVSQLRQQIEGPDEKRQDLQPAERRFRLEEQARRLAGMSLRGPLECSFSCYTLVIRMLATDEITYLAPNRFTTRAHEVQQSKPPKEVIIDASSAIKVRDSAELADTCHLPDALSLSQALTRRSLALDLCEAATFAASERWHAELLRHLQQAPPMEYKQVDTMQILRADRAAWTYMAEKGTSLKKRADGSLPMDDLFAALTTATDVMMFLMPLPAGGQSKRPSASQVMATPNGSTDTPNPAKKSRTKARRERQKQRLQEALALASAPPSHAFPPKPPTPHAHNALPPTPPPPTPKIKGKGKHKPCKSVFAAGAVHACGVGSVFGIDAWTPKSAPAPVVKLDLALDEDVRVLFLLLSNRALAAVHLAPPAALPGRGGPPLRSHAFPDGLPDLSPPNQAKVELYNRLFALASTLFLQAFQTGIVATLENPASSHFWQSSAWLDASSSIIPLQFSSVHTCMFGATFKRQLCIAHFHDAFQALQLPCDHTSLHPAHSAPRESVTTYPAPFCRAYAQALQHALGAAGSLPPAQALPGLSDIHLQARVAAGTQPRGKRVPPLLPEHKAICVLQGPAQLLPSGPVLQQPWLPCAGVQCQPHYPLLPAKSRVLCALPCAGIEKGGSSLDSSGTPSSLAVDALCKGDLSSEMCVQVLQQAFNTPLEARRAGILQDGRPVKYFVLGAYKCLPRKGVTKLTGEHLSTAAFINAFMLQRFPDASWSAFVVTHNEPSALHVDSANVPGTMNFAIGLGRGDTPSDTPMAMPAPDGVAGGSLQALIGNLSAAAQALASAAGTGSTRSYDSAAKLVKSPDVFAPKNLEEEVSQWPDWSFSFKVFVGFIDPTYAEELKKVELAPPNPADYTVGERERSTKLYAILASQITAEAARQARRVEMTQEWNDEDEELNFVRLCQEFEGLVQGELRRVEEFDISSSDEVEEIEEEPTDGLMEWYQGWGTVNEDGRLWLKKGSVRIPIYFKRLERELKNELKSKEDEDGWFVLNDGTPARFDWFMGKTFDPTGKMKRSGERVLNEVDWKSMDFFECTEIWKAYQPELLQLSVGAPWDHQLKALRFKKKRIVPIDDGPVLPRLAVEADKRVEEEKRSEPSPPSDRQGSSSSSSKSSSLSGATPEAMDDESDDDDDDPGEVRTKRKAEDELVPDEMTLEEFQREVAKRNAEDEGEGSPKKEPRVDEGTGEVEERVEKVPRLGDEARGSAARVEYHIRRFAKSEDPEEHGDEYVDLDETQLFLEESREFQSKWNEKVCETEEDLTDPCTGEWLWGDCLALNLGPCRFDGRARHATLPWVGDRWSIIAYSAVVQNDLSPTQEQTLWSCGFPLPWTSAFSKVPSAPSNAPQVRMTIGIPWDPCDFAKEAAKRGHPRHLFDGIPPVLKTAIDATVEQSEVGLAQHRTEVLRRWMLRAQEIAPQERALHDGMPKHLKAVLKGKRLLVFGEMLVACGYGDSSIASEIGKGFDLTGPIPASDGLFKPVVEPASMTKECLRAAASAVRAGILRATERVCSSELAQEVHDITKEEVDRGWLEGPVPLEQLSETCSLSRRFGVEQRSGGKRKVRPIDNLSESFINSTVSRTESIQPHGLDVVCAGIAYRLRVRERFGRASVPKLKIIDLHKAYKQLGISLDAIQDAFLCVPNPETGKPSIYACHVLPFGSSASVAAFCRSTMGLWHLGCALLLIHWTVFYDDFIVLNEASSTKHLDLVLNCFWDLLGWTVARDKESDFDYFARALGVKICFQSERVFVVENTPERKAELDETITRLLSLEWVEQHELTSLRGRLQFVEGQIHGRRSGRFMQLLSRRADFIGGSAMDSDLQAALTFLKDRVVGAPPRVISARRENAWFIFTDAAYNDGQANSCGLGGVLVAPDGKPIRFFSCLFNDDALEGLRFGDVQSPIYFLEGLAVVVALHVWNSLVQGSEAVCFVDNEAAKSAFIAGKSPCVHFSALSEWLSDWEERASSFPWFERVSSAANIADGPSRDDCSHLAGVRRDEIDLQSIILALQCFLPELSVGGG
ncbi:unnamed protein product [Symbiodinium sp. CCMP2592]|nr:unnamed protein product [Symbiodinium sp. CCMP2592]